MTPKSIAASVLLMLLPLATVAQQPTTAPAPAPEPSAIPRLSAADIDRSLDRAVQLLDEGSLTPPMMQGALDDALKLLAQNPQNTKAHLLAGELYMQTGGTSGQGDLDEARTHYGEVLKVEPSNFRANLGTAKVWIANRHWRQAAVYLERAERVAPQDKRAEVKQLLAHAYVGLGDLKIAIEKAKEATIENPDDPRSLGILAQIRYNVGQKDTRELGGAVADAEKYVKAAAKALDEKPWDRELLQQLSTAYELAAGALRGYQITLYERDYRGAPRDQLLPGKEAEAASVLARIAETLRRQAVLQSTLIEHEATMLLDRAVQYEPSDVSLLESLATAHLRTKNAEAAIETYQKILALAPNHIEARQQLAALGAAPAAGAESQPAAP